MRKFKRAVIIGVGLIGGSVGLGLRHYGIAAQVIGIARHKKNLALAKRIGAIDSFSTDLSALRGADLVILATPVEAVIALAPKIRRYIADSTIVTDVGSTKEGICKILGKLFPRYVGSHPLAGSEKATVANARIDLFKGSTCILTPQKATQGDALSQIRALWMRLGARTISMDPAEHDRILAFVSHLPHVAAFSLVGAVPRPYLKFVAGGFKDTTRIAASDSEIWSSIFLSNKKNVLKSIAVFERKLDEFKKAIATGNASSLSAIIRKTRELRESLR